MNFYSLPSRTLIGAGCGKFRMRLNLAAFS